MGAVVLTLVVIVVVVGVVVVLAGADRYRPRPRSGYSRPTDEVLVDPVSGARQRVYVEPVSGSRSYVDEPFPIAGSAVPPLQTPGLVRRVGSPTLPVIAPPAPDPPPPEGSGDGTHAAPQEGLDPR